MIGHPCFLKATIVARQEDASCAVDPTTTFAHDKVLANGIIEGLPRIYETNRKVVPEWI